MKHLQSFQSREIISLPLFSDNGWQLKRYAILANGRNFDEAVALSATVEAIKRLPVANQLVEADTNHGIGFQIIHFAETAVVSPVFYWQWGSVLAHIDQFRASWAQPTVFGDGIDEVVGCVWEMEIVSFEVEAWKTTMLTDIGTPKEKLAKYLDLHAA